MKIKNYTSDVPASRTVAEIQSLLIESRVNGLSMEYGPNQEVTALLFHVDLDRRYSIRLTANIDGVLDTFWKEYAEGEKLTSDGNAIAWGGRNGNKKKTRASFREQAARTAWRLQYDWLQVQLSLLRLQKVDFLQVFLPYLWDGKQTFYQSIKGNGLLALPGGAL